MPSKREDAIDALMAALLVTCALVWTAFLIWIISLFPLVALPILGFAFIWWMFYDYYRKEGRR